MTRRRRHRQATDARRIGQSGSGKLDQPSARGPARPQKAVDPEPNPGEDRPPAITGPTRDAARRRLLAEREILVRRFRELGVALDGDDVAPRARTDTVVDEGDEAQASERRDMALAARARLASRIERLTAAVERIERGTYGTCRVCGRAIETPRLAALPEAATCLRCQEESTAVERPFPLLSEAWGAPPARRRGRSSPGRGRSGARRCGRIPPGRAAGGP